MIPLVQLYNNRIYQVAALTVLHVGIALSILHLMEVRYAILEWRPVIWLGTLSYSLYLWQQPFLNRSSVARWTHFRSTLLWPWRAPLLRTISWSAPFSRCERDGSESRKRRLARRTYVLPPVSSRPATDPQPLENGRRRRFRPRPTRDSVLEASRTAFHAIRHDLPPHPLEDPGVVIAVGKVVIES